MAGRLKKEVGNYLSKSAVLILNLRLFRKIKYRKENEFSPVFLLVSVRFFPAVIYFCLKYTSIGTPVNPNSFLSWFSVNLL